MCHVFHDAVAVHGAMSGAMHGGATYGTMKGAMRVSMSGAFHAGATKGTSKGAMRGALHRGASHDSALACFCSELQRCCAMRWADGGGAQTHPPAVQRPAGGGQEDAGLREGPWGPQQHPPAPMRGAQAEHGRNTDFTMPLGEA